MKRENPPPLLTAPSPAVAGEGGEGAVARPAFEASTRLIASARRLRGNGTEVEKSLWAALRRGALGVRFRRQHPVPPYVADFACVEARVVVELDGGQHGGQADAARDEAMAAAGWQVLRYWNSEVVENLDGVVADIARVVVERMR
ncbi:endonuclease domain-containing protein [Falsiroseomonas sp. HW251]|uniref:endonuclease domain-containing protein n=1 Tax=Falsiroseomonas sp. HW251 TaxID=3390998 RepID=UPI003D323339